MVRPRASLIFAVALAGFSALALYLGYEYRQYYERTLQKSIAALGDILDSDISIQHEYLEAGIDPAGMWGISSPHDLYDRVEVLPQFIRADRDAGDISETEYYKNGISEVFELTNKSLDGYVLYRASFPLGAGTICSTRDCNFYILVRPNAYKAYVVIFVI